MDLNTLDQPPYVTKHAIERLRAHYPTVGVRGARAILARALPVAQGEIAGFLHRPVEKALDEYFVAHDRRGIFVLAKMHPIEGKPDAWNVVTYIRLQPSQVAVAKSLWGDGEPTHPEQAARRAS